MGMFKNSSIYIVPIKVNDRRRLDGYLAQAAAWKTAENPQADYLFPYASAVMTDRAFCSTYEYTEQEALPFYMFENRVEMAETPKVEFIRLNVFATDVAFLEIGIQYGSSTVFQIREFANRFKSASKSQQYCREIAGRISLLEGLEKILPLGSAIQSFFTCGQTSQFRRNCLCFHAVYLPEETDSERIREHLCMLPRSYHQGFSRDRGCFDSRYDKYYSPYQYLHWGISQEGIACVCNAPQDESAVFFLENYFYSQLMKDYRYLYLILLNQRFSAIDCMGRIAQATAGEKAEDLTTAIINLKTHFSFQVISDDMVYQNVYAKLFEVFEIGDFLEDLSEMNEKTASIQRQKTERQAKKTERFLLGISILAVFSALVDAADYFDRISWLKNAATWLSLIITLVIVVLCLTTIYKNKD